MAKGIPLMGRDPDGQAKIINVDENGNVKVQLKGSLDEQIFGDTHEVISSPIPPGGTAESNIIALTAEVVSLAYCCTTSDSLYSLSVIYYNSRDEEVSSEVLFDEAPDRAGTLTFHPKHRYVRFVIKNNSTAARTYRLEYARGYPERVRISNSAVRKTTWEHENPVEVSYEDGPAVVVEDHVFHENTYAWAFYALLAGGSSSNALDYLKLRVEFSNSSPSYGGRYYSPGGGLVFSQDFGLSLLDEFDKALIIPDSKSIVLAGKYVNVPIGRLMRLSLVSTRDAVPDYKFVLNAFSLVEEGNY